MIGSAYINIGYNIGYGLDIVGNVGMGIVGYGKQVEIAPCGKGV